jgi:type IV pilus assembly protein PilO
MSFAKLFSKLQNSSWQVQLGVIAGVAVLLFGAFWYFVTGGKRQEIANLSEQVESLKRQNAELQIVQQRVNELRETFKGLESQYDELKVLLPEQREITNVLDSLQARARGNSLSLMRFKPKEDKEDSKGDFYSGKPVEVLVSSNFNNLRSFFEEMAKYQRIVSITDFKLNQIANNNGGRTLDSQFILTAYYSTPEQLNNLLPKAPAKPGPQNGKPANAAPPANKPTDESNGSSSGG